MTATAPASPTARSPVDARYLRLLGCAALVGIPAGFLAAAFLALVHALEDALWPDSPAWYLVLGLPVAGAAVVVLARRLLPGDGGHPPLAGLSTTPTPLSWAPGVALAALGTLAFGAVLGPEAPVLALGSVVGVAVARLLHADRRGTAVLSLAGSMSAMSALFGGPLVAGMLMLEGGVGLGAGLMPVLLPGLVAAAVGYVIFVGLGGWEGLATPGLTVPDLPAYQGTHVLDLLVAVAAGAVTAVLIAAVKRLAVRIGDAGLPRLGMPALLLAGGLAVGVVAELGELLGADARDELFSGQAAVPDVVTTGSVGIVVVLLVGKALGYATSLGCGFRGGPIFPAVFLGVAVCALAVAGLGLSPTVAVAAGAGAGMAAQTGLLVAPVLFAALLVGKAGVDASSAAVLGTAAAWLTSCALARPR